MLTAPYQRTDYRLCDAIADSAVSNDEERLLADHFAFAVSIVRKRIRNRPIEDDDIQDALIDLLRAIRAFDPQSGYNLTTLATTYVNNGINERHLRSQRIMRRTIPHSIDGGDEYRQLESREEPAEVDRETIQVALASMTDRQRFYAVKYFLEGNSDVEIAKLEGVTHQAVGQAICIGLQKARKAIGLPPQYGRRRPSKRKESVTQ
jgi:RNA polymerase sigma factor (sigma-70 family)